MIKGKVKPIHDNVLVYDMHFGETTTSGGIIIGNDDGKAHGVKARWARVYAKGPANKDEYEPGDWILIAHGRWSRKMKVDCPELGEVEIQKVEVESILAAADKDYEPSLSYYGEEYSHGSTANFDPGMFGAN